jgi:predicted AlkP superfamily phosphohydrolase/phosphomutase
MKHKSERRVFWLIVDAASFPVVKELLQQEKLPHLQSLYRQGLGGPLQVESFNCQTPAALAALFTGKPSSNHGIGGFYTPLCQARHSLLEKRTSFLENHFDGCLIWEWAARNHRTISLAHTPYSQGIRSHQDRYRFVVDGYSQRVSRGQVFHWTQLETAGTADPARERRLHWGGHAFHLHRVTRHQDGKPTEQLRVTPEYGSPITLDLTGITGGGRRSRQPWQRHTLNLKQNTTTALYPLPGQDKNDLLLLFTGLYRLTSPVGSDMKTFLQHSGAFQGESVGRFFRAGVLGKTLPQGGSGFAENLFLDLLQEMNDYYARVLDFFLLQPQAAADLTIAYIPAIDEMGHEFMGFSQEDCPCYRPRDAGTYRQFIRAAYGQVDTLLGKILAAVPARTSVLLTSDHGMNACSHELYLNEILKRQGLLEFNADGTVAPGSTTAFYHPAENGAIFINREDFPGGIIPPPQVESIKQQVKHLLEHYYDDTTQTPIAHRIIDTKALPFKNKQVYGDLFFIPQSHYTVKAGPGSHPTVSTSKSGCHHFNQGNDRMKGIFFVKSPYVNRKAGFQPIGCHDLFPLVCQLLDIPVPTELAAGVPAHWFTPAPPGETEIP